MRQAGPARAARRALIIGSCAAGALAGCAATSVPRRPDAAALFSQNCDSCHSLIGNESLHRQGGDLLGYHLSRAILAQFTREMPVRRPLSSDELTAIVAYVYGAERRAQLRGAKDEWNVIRAGIAVGS